MFRSRMARQLLVICVAMPLNIILTILIRAANPMIFDGFITALVISAVLVAGVAALTLLFLAVLAWVQGGKE